MQKLGSWLANVWRSLLLVLFLFLCARSIGLSLYEARTDILPTAILSVSALAMGYWKPFEALIAFTALELFVNGLAQATILNCASPLSLIFSSLMFAISIREINDSELKTVDASAPLTLGVLLMVDLLVTAVTVSLGGQILEHRSSLGAWLVSGEQAVYGFGDRHYFLTSAFLWLQGLFYFKAVYLLLGRCDMERRLSDARISFVFYSLAATLAVFFVFQYCAKIPRPLIGFGYYMPCEDISSFGSACVIVLAFFAAQLNGGSLTRNIFFSLSLIVLLLLVVASWSRATWLGVAIVLGVLCLLRSPRRLFAGALVVGMMAIVFININAERQSWLRNPYLIRAVNLARLESPTRKSPERIFLYHKALDAIRLHPLSGIGIGSFYRASVGFSRPGDPNGATPDFAHNAFLQIAVELGVPVSVLFLCLVVVAMGAGFLNWFRARGTGDQRRESVLLGVTLSLSGYVLTQMTANSLNVYFTNQFLFWFLVAAVLVSGRPNSHEIASACDA